MEVFEIIKKRYPEVILVIGLQVGLSVLAGHLSAEAPEISATGEHVGNLPAGLDFIFGMSVVVIWVMWQMLFLGFLRTAALYGSAQQEPKTLLVTGKPFFWRVFRFHAVMSIFYLFPMLMYTSSAAANAQSNGVEVVIATKYLFMIIMSISVVLMKPLLLIPAIMIGKDRMVAESMIESRTYRIRDARKLILLFVGWVCFLPVFPMLSAVLRPGILGLDIMSGVSTAISSAIWMVTALYAIQFVVGEEEVAVENAEVAEEI